MTGDFSSLDYRFRPGQWFLGGVGRAGVLGVLLHLVLPRGQE